MKKFFFLLPFIFLFSSCIDLDRSMIGTYYTNTIDGLLYLDLMDGGNCIVHFQGGSEDSGYWHIVNGSEISLSVTTEKEKNGWTAQYWIGFLSGHGTIYKDGSFSIPSKRLYRGETKELTLTFEKDTRR